MSTVNALAASTNALAASTSSDSIFSTSNKISRLKQIYQYRVQETRNKIACELKNYIIKWR